MQETVAAAVLRYSMWDGSVPLYDPMCGSGSLLCEALMHYCRIPSGILREHFGFAFLPDYDNALWIKANCRIPSGILREHFGFAFLPDFDNALWIKAKKRFDRQIRELPEGLVAGSDLLPEAVKISKTNIQNLPYGDKVKLEPLDFRKIERLDNRVIITNPPYGIRTGSKKKLDLLYKSLGDFLKQRCKGSIAYIYFGEREFIKKIGLKPTWKKPLKTGGLDGRLVKYEMF
jgi:putative N6-adenine-specific DNA methylase